MNDNRLKSSVLDSGRAKVLKSVVSREIRAALAALGAALALVLLSGCASVPAHGDSDPWQYNPNNGYPAVGAGSPFWHM